ncbi:MAG: fibronectin type III domain-containing protein [Pedosphaera sp.]|nr:fibronectin type III domain-containing protein [Pedosphaera sp.]
MLDGCYEWCKRTRDYLKQYLGEQCNQSWTQAGFHNSIAVDNSYSFLSALLSALAALFDEQSAWQDAAHGITGEQAQALLTSLSNAATAVTQGRLASGLAREPRDEALTAMRERLRGLCNELRQQIGAYDQRWLAFGLNIPGASSTPAVPQNVTAISYGFGQILATCDASPRATHYRFFTQANLEEPEPVFGGSSPTPTLVLSGLEPGQLYQVYVSAANEAGESDLSEPASATPIELAKAA